MQQKRRLHQNTFNATIDTENLLMHTQKIQRFYSCTQNRYRNESRVVYLGHSVGGHEIYCGRAVITLKYIQCLQQMYAKQIYCSRINATSQFCMCSSCIAIPLKPNPYHKPINPCGSCEQVGSVMSHLRVTSPHIHLYLDCSGCDGCRHVYIAHGGLTSHVTYESCHTYLSLPWLQWL